MSDIDNTGPGLIIIRRKHGKVADVPKGGVWKIAHADFMTAMMALFLVLWLVNATSPESRTTVAQYFNPIRLTNLSHDRKGVRDPQETMSGETDLPGRYDKKDESGRAKATERQPGTKLQERTQVSAHFEDPYAILAEASASRPASDAQMASAVTLGSSGRPGMEGGEALRDPFDPNFWHQVLQVEQPAKPAPASASADKVAKPDIAPAAAPVIASVAATRSLTGERAGEARNVAVPRPAEVQPLTPRPDGKPPAPVAAQRAADAATTSVIAAAIASDRGPGKAAGAPQVEVRNTDEGVLISLTDNASFGMFAIGSAEPAPETVTIMQRVATALNKREGSIVIRGHTDARPFRTGGGDNWRLSTARAHTAQDLLIRGGIDEARIEHVEGYASRKLRTTDPAAAENRRIEILLREKRI
ncbi:MAG: MotB family protein [Bosea sp.]|uniref:MotB family protein n=1 Tax=Bosea sp. (in: a-proteobacteria) TaxID=1871050 RepID=UPI00239B829E|nr:MotB family protein [Bosea sp. (in: a-proteobacteria)]MCP4737749.1 MotB family protein [Bosea sp. (in: a-proteobacteria)]